MATIKQSGDNLRIEMGYETVTLDKLFGPLVFANLRIHADPKTCEWVIERRIISSGRYVEWVRIPGQLDEEFSDQDSDAVQPQP